MLDPQATNLLKEKWKWQRKRNKSLSGIEKRMSAESTDIQTVKEFGMSPKSLMKTSVPVPVMEGAGEGMDQRLV